MELFRASSGNINQTIEAKHFQSSERAAHLWPLAEGKKERKKKTWYAGTTFWNGELLNIYSSSRERWWNIFVLCGWREDLKRVKNREIEAEDHESLSLNDKYKENGFHVCDHCTTEVCNQNSLFVFLLSFFPPLFWLKQIFSSLPKYTAVTSPNFQCL